MEFGGPFRLTGLLCVILTFYFSFVTCHPQCLDFKPPFSSERSEPFCPQYKDFGCCTYAEDATLAFNYMNIARELLARNLWHCSSYIRDLLCQPCSPYAAHIYDGEGPGPSRRFPGLCEGYCRMVHRECSEALFVLAVYVSGEPNLMHSIWSEDLFCSKVNLTDQDYCYPELLSNPMLNERIHFTTVNSEGCLCVETFADNLKNPVIMESPGDGSGRLFIGEQYGVISIIYEDTKIRLDEHFLNISEAVDVGKQRGDERGLLGLAFHPHFRLNSRFFVFYMTRSFGSMKTRISEFTVLPWNPNKADRRSERVLLELDQIYDNHNGGALFFADDGYLYISIGDGGAAGDPDNNAQNLTSLFGKMLRIDVDTQPVSSDLSGRIPPYAIPVDNPYVHRLDARPEIYAYGIRNMWRCGKDTGNRVTGHGSGRIICADVGQSAFEELDILKKGVNYGWRGREGFECYDDEQCGNIGPEELPIFAYPHSVGKSITGGHFYRGCDHPNLDGHYIYGDYWTGKLFRLEENQNPLSDHSDQWQNRQIDMCGPEYCKNGLHSEYGRWILAFGLDSAGEVYMLSSASSRSGIPNGAIYKIVDPRRRNNPLICHNRRRESYSVHSQRTREIHVANSTVKTPSSKQRPKVYSHSASTSTQFHSFPLVLVFGVVLHVSWVEIFTDS